MKTNKINKIPFYRLIGVFMIVLITASCGKSPLSETFYSIEIFNNSSDTICPYLAIGGGNTQYPDTLLPIEKPALVKIAPNERFYYDSREPWSERINKLVADTLSIFIIDSRIYKDSSWIKIRNENLILKRYDLSVAELEYLNWRVIYP